MSLLSMTKLLLPYSSSWFISARTSNIGYLWICPAENTCPKLLLLWYSQRNWKICLIYSSAYRRVNLFDSMWFVIILHVKIWQLIEKKNSKPRRRSYQHQERDKRLKECTLSTEGIFRHYDIVVYSLGVLITFADSYK